MDWVKGVLLVGLAALVALFWSAFAPTLLGGRATYAIVEGASMDPLIQRGDLLVLHKTATVKVDDVVGYRSGGGALVVHRVIKAQGERLVFKGDANWWVDTDTRTAAETVGTLWLRVPGLGQAYRWLQEPWLAGLLAGCLVALVVGTDPGPRRRTPGGYPSQPRPERIRPLRPGMVWARGYGKPLAGAGAALFVLALASFLFAQVNNKIVTTHPVELQHTGAYRYGAPRPPLPDGAIYDGDIETGDPIFVDLTPTVNVVFQYQLETDGRLEDVTGTVHSYFVLRDVTGWTYRGATGPEATFSGPVATASGRLDLVPLLDAATAFQKTRQGYSNDFTGAAVVSVHVQGKVDGQPFEDTFSPYFVFRIRPPYEVLVETPSPDLLAGMGDDPATAAPDRFTAHEKTAVDLPLTGEGKLSVGPFLIHADETRGVAAVVMASVLLSFAGLWYAYRDARRLGTLDRIYLTYGPELVRASFPERTAGMAVVPGETIEEIVNMARVEGKLVLWDERPWSSVFFLLDDGPTIYVYEMVALDNADDEKMEHSVEEIGNAP